MKFEDFLYTQEGEDLFEKTEGLDRVLSSSQMTGSEGLGVQMLEKAGPSVKIKERSGCEHEVIMLGSNSYLNLTTNKKVCDAAIKAIEKYGYGMGAVSVYAGISDIHKELEKRIANFYKTEDAVLFPSGYGTNIGVISALCSKEDIIINDSANHASIFDGSKLSGADVRVYPHNDMKALEHILEKCDKLNKPKLIITDGVFSMYGDIARLDKICELAHKWGAKVMVDDAHGLGIVGATGRGSAQVYGVENKIDLNVGMLSKTAGAVGGYCATTRKIAQYLRHYARSFFFSTALPAPTVAGLNEVFKLLEHDRAGRKELWQNINYIKEKLNKLGFNTGETQSGIVPIIIGDEQILFKMYQDLRLSGVYTNIVTYPAVRRKECRLRLCIMKDLTQAQIDRAVEIIAKIGKKYGII